MRIEFLGAAHTVTGSCYLLETGAHKLLIDCGMFQGGKRIRQLNTEAFRFNPGEIECLLLTHAHIDHCGLIPRLCREGFKGPVYATKVTCELAHIMLPDSAHIQESDAEIFNRKGARSGDEPIQPLYTIDDAEASLKHFSVVPYENRVRINENVEAVFHDAGHIIGSAIIEVYVTEDGETYPIGVRPDTDGKPQPVRAMGGDFTLGRPAHLADGFEQVACFAFSFDGLRFDRARLLSWVVSIDGEEIARLPMRVQNAQQ